MSIAVASVALPFAAVLAFGCLTVALAALWAPRALARRAGAATWAVPGALAVLAAGTGGVIDAGGLLALVLFGILCVAARRTSHRALSPVLHLGMLVLCAALFVHVLPGFENPRVIEGEVLSRDALPYTKYLNFDKGMAALLLLGLYAPERTGADAGWRHGRWLPLLFALVIGTVMLAATASGSVRWEPKLPSWWDSWIWMMVFFTALPEEALFRGIVQDRLQRWFGGTAGGRVAAVVAAGGLFGLAHVAGGPVYVILATLAGIGYGTIYVVTRSLAAATLAHAGLNAVHLFFFTYPGIGHPGFQGSRVLGF